MAQAIVLGLLTLAGQPWIGTWQIVLLALLAGTATAFNQPAAQAFVADLVERKDDLASGIALNTALNNLSRMVAPALAGVLIAMIGTGQTGEGVCFLLNGASYLAVLASLWAIRLHPTAQGPAPTPLLTSLMEGIRYVASFRPLLHLLILASVIGLLGTPSSLLPIFAHKLSGNASGLGFLLGAAGLGALLGTIYVASRPGLGGTGRRIAVGTLVLGVTLAAFAYTPYLPSAWLALGLALGFRFASGLAMMVVLTSCSTAVQVLTDDDKRGRVMSLYSMAFLGLMPLGNLLAGALASVTSAELVFLLSGCCCIVSGLWFLLQVPGLRALVQSRRAEPAHPREGLEPAHAVTELHHP
jgi:MFS family permease